MLRRVVTTPGDGCAIPAGRAAVFLCSDDADYITGAQLSINGGLFM